MTRARPTVFIVDRSDSEALLSMHIALAAADSCGLQADTTRLASSSNDAGGWAVVVLGLDAIGPDAGAAQALGDRCVIFSKAHPDFLSSRINKTVIWAALNERPDAIRHAISRAPGVIDRVVVAEDFAWEKGGEVPLVVTRNVLPRHPPMVTTFAGRNELKNPLAWLPFEGPYVIMPISRSGTLGVVAAFARQVRERLPALSILLAPECPGVECFARYRVAGRTADDVYMRKALDVPGVYLTGGFNDADPASWERRLQLAKGATAVLIAEGSRTWNYALASYLQAGSAVIGTPTGSNLWQIVDGYNGFLRRDIRGLVQLLAGFLEEESTHQVRRNAASEAESLTTSEAYRVYLSAFFDDLQL